MMENIQNESYTDGIRWLTYKKAFGSISDEQDQYLTEAIENNKEARATWEQAMSEFNDPDNQNHFRASTFMTVPNWEALSASKNRKGRTRRIYTILAAACVFGAAAIAYFTLTPSLKIEGPAQITLTTASGDRINLSNPGAIKTDKAILNNQNNTLSFTPTVDEPNTSINTLTVPSGLDYKITLSDGTLVWMNSETKLDFPFKFASTRQISIKGEAYFEIAKEASRPFIVHLPGGKEIRVLGTSFNVNAYDEQDSRVSLITGAVSLKSGRDSLTLKPGIQATILRDNITTAPFNEQLVLSWREGIFHIKYQKMSEVIKVASRWYGLKIVIDTPELGERVFSGKLDRNTPISSFLDIAKEVVEFDYHYDDSGTLHLK